MYVQAIKTVFTAIRMTHESSIAFTSIPRGSLCLAPVAAPR